MDFHLRAFWKWQFFNGRMKDRPVDGEVDLGRGDRLMDASGSSHPTDQTLRAYGVGQLYGDLAESVHSHLVSCADCRQRVAEVSAGDGPGPASRGPGPA